MAGVRKTPKKTSANTKAYRIQKSAANAESIDNVIILENNAKLIEESMGSALVAAMEEIGLAAERFAKKKCPVDTGRLRNSITHVHGGNEVYIGTNVEYAPYVELGTGNGKKQPFLVPAASDHKAYYERILKKHMQGQ